MSNPMGSFGRSRRVAFPTLPNGETVATYATYQEAQDAVDRLAHADFPVQGVSIVGNDMKSVERVTGRLSWGRAAGAGAVTGLWFGLFLGILTDAFSPSVGGGYLFGAILLGAAFGMLFGVGSYALTRRRRDFSSVMQMMASSFSLIVDPEQGNRARNVLGLEPGQSHALSGDALPAAEPAHSAPTA